MKKLAFVLFATLLATSSLNAQTRCSKDSFGNTTCRDSYGNTLKELAAEGHDDLVVLDADLAAATKTGMFRKAHPDRHFDCGIAEGNMMGVAAGLATLG